MRLKIEYLYFRTKIEIWREQQQKPNCTCYIFICDVTHFYEEKKNSNNFRYHMTVGVCIESRSQDRSIENEFKVCLSCNVP